MSNDARIRQTFKSPTRIVYQIDGLKFYTKKDLAEYLKVSQAAAKACIDKKVSWDGRSIRKYLEAMK